MDVGFNTMVEVVGKYGIGALVILVLCFISYKIIKHLLMQSDRILESSIIAQEKWQKAIDDHTIQAREFHQQVSDAHKFQREEHNVMMKSLEENCRAIVEFRLNIENFNKDHEASQRISQKICDNLDEQKAILVRINGFKHP